MAFAENVFPEVDWSARVPEELLMGSTIYQRGEVSGQRKLLGLQLRKRFGENAEQLVTRAHQADESMLIQVGELLAERLSDQELLDKLEQVLPRPEEAAEYDAEDDEAE